MEEPCISFHTKTQSSFRHTNGHTGVSTTDLEVLLRQGREAIASLEGELMKRQHGRVLLALVSVFERMRMVCRRLAGAVLPQSGRRYDMVREAVRAHTSMPSGMLLAGGERGACPSWEWLLLNEYCLWNCRIACRRRLLRRVGCFLVPWGCFPTECQLRHQEHEPRTRHLDPLVVKIAADYS